LDGERLLGSGEVHAIAADDPVPGASFEPEATAQDRLPLRAVREQDPVPAPDPLEHGPRPGTRSAPLALRHERRTGRAGRWTLDFTTAIRRRTTPARSPSPPRAGGGGRDRGAAGCARG